jgi:hypothetical protein
MLTSIPHRARVITRLVIEEILSRGVETCSENRVLTNDVDTEPEAPNKDLENGKSSPSSFEPRSRRCLSLDGSFPGKRRGYGGCGYYIACN